MDYFDDEDYGFPDIKMLVEQYEAALADNRQFHFDEDAAEHIASYYETFGHYDKALRIINSALEQHPFSGYLLLRKAQLLFDLKILEESLACLERLETIDPGDPGACLLRAEIYTFQSRHEEALAELDKAMENADVLDTVDTWLHRADVYEDWEKYDEVYGALRECLKIDPVNEEALSRMHYCMELTGRFEDAVELHRSILEDHPYCTWAWYNLSFAYGSLELFEKAIDALQYVIAIDEEHSYAYKDLAHCYCETGQFNLALEALADYSAKVKPEAEVCLLEGRCHFEVGDIRAARSAYRKAIRTNPSMHEAFYNLGMTYVVEEQWKQAFQNLRKALDLCPDNIDYLERLAEVALQTDAYEEARYCCHKAIAMQSANVRLYITLALAYLFDEEGDEALTVILHGINRCEDSVQLRYIHAAMLLLLNRKQAGMLELEDLLDESFGDHVVLFTYFPFLREDRELMALIAHFE